MHAETRGRGRVLADTVAGLLWRYGNAAVHRGAEPEDAEADRWATGIPTLDLRLTPGGLPPRPPPPPRPGGPPRRQGPPAPGGRAGGERAAPPAGGVGGRGEPRR